MSEIEFKEKLKTLIENKDKIPNEFWVLAENGKRVIWFLNREDGTAEVYETAEERLGLTKEGEILWGYSSGCSCWDGWDSVDYENSVSYKEFIIKNIKSYERKESADKPQDCDLSFSEGWEEECLDNLNDYLLLIKDNISPEKIFKAKNAEVRRYLIKKVSFDKIKESIKCELIHKDNDYELWDFYLEEKERYVKVKDSSTDREYLLYVPDRCENCKQAIAWTFNLSEKEYNPIMET